MSNENSGPAEGIKGVVEDVKGKAKEAVGAVTGSDGLTKKRARLSRTRPMPSATPARRKPRPKGPGAAQRRPRSARMPSSGRR